MKAILRRKEIVRVLHAATEPIPGGELAAHLGVSRQSIVQDIAVLKASGFEVLATHNGYLLQKSPLVERVFKVRHTKEQTGDELTTIIACGGTVVDVIVRHKVYGRIEAALNIASRSHVERFLDGVRSGKSTELMEITGGYHYHTVRAESEAVLAEIEAKLTAKGYLVPEL